MVWAAQLCEELFQRVADGESGQPRPPLTDENDGRPRLEEQIELELRLLRERTTNASVLSLSMLEIYNECVFDLLKLAGDKGAKREPAATAEHGGLNIRHHKTLGAYVEGLSSRLVESADDVLNGAFPGASTAPLPMVSVLRLPAASDRYRDWLEPPPHARDGHERQVVEVAHGRPARARPEADARQGRDHEA
jgi:hypothetical protein